MNLRSISFSLAAVLSFSLAHSQYTNVRVSSLLSVDPTGPMNLIPPGKHYARFYADDLPGGTYVHELDNGSVPAIEENR